MKYETEANGHKPLSLPVAILIDNSHWTAARCWWPRCCRASGMQQCSVSRYSSINGAVLLWYFHREPTAVSCYKTGEIVLNDKRPLVAAFHTDLAMPAQDDVAMINAAGAYLAKQK